MDHILYWNDVAMEANRVSHTAAGGEQTGPTLSSRAAAIVHVAMHDAYFGVNATAGQTPYVAGGSLPTPGTNAAAAVAAAATTTLSALYPSQRATFEQALNGTALPGSVTSIPATGAADSGAYGRAVAGHVLSILAIKPSEPGASDKGYASSLAPGRHRPDPLNPEQGYHAPFYGTTAPPIAAGAAVVGLDPPPGLTSAAYAAALTEVLGKGAATGSSRSTDETAIGHFWAYDGPAKIGTPPRLYNQIARQIAGQMKNSEAENARLFALMHAAMGDAGKLAWADKYKFDLWRPVIGIREKDGSMGPTAGPSANPIEADCDPFWLPLGAPKTNEQKKSFTPPFPAYPSGHATFGAAAFQSVRRFYGFSAQAPDNLAFDFVSDELNGINVDPNGSVRTRHRRHFKSLWQAIFENGVSRVYLGVHWHFDAFAASDVLDANGKYKDSDQINYSQRVGGVRLGLDIANVICDARMGALKVASSSSAAKPLKKGPGK